MVGEFSYCTLAEFAKKFQLSSPVHARKKVAHERQLAVAPLSARAIALTYLEWYVRFQFVYPKYRASCY